jgi:2-polyprenyl-3-methyl-5-hydroxy-6-metoxy-1,4-benzoquinol methylase
MNKYDTDLNLSLRELLLINKDMCSELIKKEKDSSGSVLEARDCPVCGSADHIKKINNGFFEYRKCKACGLVYMSPGLKDDIVTKGFSDKDDYNRMYWELMKERVLSIKSKNAPDPATHPVLRDILPVMPHGKLLDVGCSVGNLLTDASYFYDTEGNEINPMTAQIAKSRGLKIHTMPIGEIKGKDRYDVIAMNQLLYGLKDPISLMKECARLLKKGGILYINTPNSDSLSMRLFKGEHCHLLGKTTLNVFNRKSLQMTADICDLKIVTFYTEWLDLFVLDVVSYLFMRKIFIHRRNHFIPFYEAWAAFEEKTQTVILGNKFKNVGDYCICIMEK